MLSPAVRWVRVDGLLDEALVLWVVHIDVGDMHNAHALIAMYALDDTTRTAMYGCGWCRSRPCRCAESGRERRPSVCRMLRPCGHAIVMHVACEVCAMCVDAMIYRLCG